MISRIDHVSLAVNNYEKAFEFYTKILGVIPQSRGIDNNLKYQWELFKFGDLSRFELLKTTGKDSFLKNFLSDKIGGIHHLTLQTPDIKLLKASLEENNVPYFNYGDYGETWKELFIHPKDTFGVLLQIAEFNPNTWIHPEYKMTEGEKWSISKEGDKYKITFAHPGGSKVKLTLEKDELKNFIHDLQKSTE